MTTLRLLREGSLWTRPEMNGGASAVNFRSTEHRPSHGRRVQRATDLRPAVMPHGDSQPLSQHLPVAAEERSVRCGSGRVELGPEKAWEG